MQSMNVIQNYHNSHTKFEFSMHDHCDNFVLMIFILWNLQCSYLFTHWIFVRQPDTTFFDIRPALPVYAREVPSFTHFACARDENE